MRAPGSVGHVEHMRPDSPTQLGFGRKGRPFNQVRQNVYSNTANAI